MKETIYPNSTGYNLTKEEVALLRRVSPITVLAHGSGDGPMAISFGNKTPEPYLKEEFLKDCKTAGVRVTETVTV